MKNLIFSTFVALLGTSVASAADWVGKVTAPDFFPKIISVHVVQAGTPGPHEPKYKEIAIAEAPDFSLKLDTTKKYDVWCTVPGVPVRIRTNWQPKGDDEEIAIDKTCGVIVFYGDNQIRPKWVTVTPENDRGPDEKGHRVVQKVASYRTAMLVPAGDYALWVTGTLNARSQRVVERVRVLPGKINRID